MPTLRKTTLTPGWASNLLSHQVCLRPCRKGSCPQVPRASRARFHRSHCPSVTYAQLCYLRSTHRINRERWVRSSHKPSMRSLAIVPSKYTVLLVPESLITIISSVRFRILLLGKVRFIAGFMTSRLTWNRRDVVNHP